MRLSCIGNKRIFIFIIKFEQYCVLIGEHTLYYACEFIVTHFFLETGKFYLEKSILLVNIIGISKRGNFFFSTMVNKYIPRYRSYFCSTFCLKFNLQRRWNTRVFVVKGKRFSRKLKPKCLWTSHIFKTWRNKRN